MSITNGIIATHKNIVTSFSTSSSSIEGKQDEEQYLTDLGESLLLAHFKNGLGRLFIFIHLTILKHFPTEKNISKIFGFSIFKL